MRTAYQVDVFLFALSNSKHGTLDKFLSGVSLLLWGYRHSVCLLAK